MTVVKYLCFLSPSSSFWNVAVLKAPISQWFYHIAKINLQIGVKLISEFSFYAEEVTLEISKSLLSYDMNVYKLQPRLVSGQGNMGQNCDLYDQQ